MCIRSSSQNKANDCVSLKLAREMLHRIIYSFAHIAEQGLLLSEAGVPGGEHSRWLRCVRRRAAHCARQGAHREGLSPRN